MKKHPTPWLWIVFLSILLPLGNAVGGKPKCDLVAVTGTGSMTLYGGLVPAFVGADQVSVIDENGAGTPVAVDFTATQLGVVELDPATGAATLITSHDYRSSNKGGIRFTTVDEIKLIPVGGSDPTCVANDCGMIFRIRLIEGSGKYNCGEIVTGMGTDPQQPFTSFVEKAIGNSPPTVNINALGKLCTCK